MNYLAHAVDCLDDPYQVAGAAVPDWLGLTLPRLRCRLRHALPFVQTDDACLAAIARGVVRHHQDDEWFHQTTAFADVTLQLAREIRRFAGDDDGMRPSFVAHVLTEMLLDATLAIEQPERLGRYYEALERVDPARAVCAVGCMTGRGAWQLAPIISRFKAAKYLYDYTDDRLLLVRLNQVMKRVRLSEFPERFTQLLPRARSLVSAARDRLLTPLAAPA